MLLRSSTRASLSQQLATRFSYTWVHRHSSMLRPLAHTPIYSTADEYVEDSEPERVELRKKQRKTTSQRGATKCFAEESKHSRPPTSSKPHQAEQRTSVIEISGALSLPCFFVNLAFINASNRRLRLRQFAISQIHSQGRTVRCVNISKQIPRGYLSYARCANGREGG